MSSPRRRGPAAAALLTCALLAPAACGDGDEALDPDMRAPATGTYFYVALIHTADGEEPDTFDGTLHISVSSEDSIIGTWDVPGYTGAPARGIWNINAYTLPADPTSLQGTITHRIWRMGSGNLTCTLTYERVDMPADTFRTSTENDCSLARD